MNELQSKTEKPSPTLQSLFSEERVASHKGLVEAHTLPELADRIENLLLSLQDRFLNLLPVSKARFAKRSFGWIGVLPAVLKAAATTEYSLDGGTSPASFPASLAKAQLLAALIQAVLAFLGLMAIVHISLTGSVFLCLLLFLLGLEMVGIILTVWAGGNKLSIFWIMLGLPAPKQRDGVAETSHVKATLCVDATKICDALMEAFAGIDRAISDQEETKVKAQANTLTDYPYVLDLLQKLVSVATQGNAANALTLASEARSVLLNYQIKAHVFDPAWNSDWFDAEPAATPGIRAHTTDLVALTRDDTILRRGRVIEPYKSDV